MKVTFSDYLVAGLIMTMMWGASAFLTFVILSPYLISIFSYYGYVIAIMLFITFYGFISGLTLRFLLFFKPLKLGEFSMDDKNFAYWKLLTNICMFGQRTLFLLSFPPMIPFLAKFFGAKIGKNVAIGGNIDSPFLITVGDNTVLGHGSLISGNIIQNGKIILGPVHIGSHSTLGVYSFVPPNVEIGDNVMITAGSVITLGCKIPNNEIWKGNPARKWQ